MKYKKIGKILVLDKEYSSNNDLDYENLIKQHNVDTIIKIKSISGQMREPDIEILAGDKTTETIHKENGCLFKLDLSKVMWSKGNNNERLRISKLVKKGEIVTDMFAGIGYFTIPIAVHSKAKRINAIEINPNSYRYLLENIKLNKITEDKINPILGDSNIEAPNYKADRIIMGYVKTTHHFLKSAIKGLNENGILHYHETVPEKLLETRPIDNIKKAAENREVELINIQKVKKYSPGVWHVVIDAKIY